MGSELAKTLRAMSDDHRMVPDFSEQLLDIADAIERLQKERDEALKQFSLDASQAQNQIDKAAAQRVEIRDLQGRLWSVRESRDHARKQRDEQKEKADERGESFAKAIQDYNTMREERDAALAEVERLKVQRDKAMAIGGVNFCVACGDEPVLEEKALPLSPNSLCLECRTNICQSDLAS